MKTNAEGLTWAEWFGATMYNKSDFTDLELKALKASWNNGEDPTDWRAVGLKQTKLSISINNKKY